jgi:DNA replication protein DnaC
MNSTELEKALHQMKLHYLANHLEAFCQAKTQLSTRELVAKIVELELLEKQKRSAERRLNDARLGRFKMMADFDWLWPKEIDRLAVESLFNLKFMREKENIILAGAQGLGKSMIARNLGQTAVLQGFSTLFTSASELVADLGNQESIPALHRRLKRYYKPDLLIIDEIGYLSFDIKAADLMFDVISRRYETASIVMTTNLAFKDWHTIFPAASCLVALLDRLTHHSEVLTIKGDSYRTKEAKEKKLAKQNKK